MAIYTELHKANIWVQKCFYFIYTEIYTVKYCCSCLCLDEQCIFTVICFTFHSVNRSMYEIKTSYYEKCLNDFYSWVVVHKKNSLICCAQSLIFLMHCNLWMKIVHALFPWNNLNLCGSRKSLCSFTNQDWDEKVWMVVLIGNFHDNYKQINIIIIMEF